MTEEEEKDEVGGDKDEVRGEEGGEEEADIITHPHKAMAMGGEDHQHTGTTAKITAIAKQQIEYHYYRRHNNNNCFRFVSKRNVRNANRSNKYTNWKLPSKLVNCRKPNECWIPPWP